MSGGAAFVSSCAQDDDSDRGEDQEDVPSFVVPVTPGDEVASLRFDDTHNYGDAEGDSMGMSPQQAGSRTPCMADDITETERQWRQYIAHYKGKAPHPYETHFVAWRPVGELGEAPEREKFAGVSPGQFRGRQAPESAMEVFQLFFTRQMFARIIECTNDRVQRILDGRTPKPDHLRKNHQWPPQWCKSWTPLDYRCLCLWIACCVARQIVNVDESYAWSKAPYVSIPGIASIMSRDRYLAIKWALSFQRDHESTGDQQLNKIGLLLDHFRNACETSWNPFRELSVDEMMVLFTGSSKWKFERQPKPTPVGLKLLGLACPRTGYVVSFLLDKKGESTVEDKVMTLCRRVKGMWYHLEGVYGRGPWGQDEVNLRRSNGKEGQGRK